MSPVPRHQPSASIFPPCLPPQPSSQANNPFHRPFAGDLLSSILPVPAGIGAPLSGRNIKLTVNGIEFTFTEAVTNSRGALNLATNTAGSFAEQFSGTLTN